MRRLFYAALLLPVLVIAACGDSDLDVSGGDSREDPDEPGGDGGTTGPNGGLLVSIGVDGGQMFPPRHRLGSPPMSTVYNDGTTVTTGVR